MRGATGRELGVRSIVAGLAQAGAEDVPSSTEGKAGWKSGGKNSDEINKLEKVLHKQ